MVNILVAIVPPIITGALGIVVCMINNHYQTNKTNALIEYKLGELAKRVDKHNNVIERTFKLEQQMALVDEKIRVSNHRIDDLESIAERK